MPQSARFFAERLNACLDDMDAPTSSRERSAILSKMLNIPKQEAWTYVEGQVLPNHDTIIRIAEEFEVDPKWLSGEK